MDEKYWNEKYYKNLEESQMDFLNEKTAVYPFCSVDTVVPLEINNSVNHFKVTKEIQEKIKNAYLGR